MPDTVYCNELALSVEIGFHKVELGVKQTVHVDLELACDFGKGPSRDDMEGLVDYYVIAGHLERHVEGRRYALIEALAVDLAREVIRLFPSVRVRVRVTKRPLDMPRVGSVAVECVRTAADFAVTPA
jgi:dihydroneopterin aldolase